MKKLTIKFPAHWLEEIVEKISERNLSEITLSTGKTPSGHIHIGILREIIICDALRRIFAKKEIKVKFYLFLDSLDAAKRFPEYIDINFQKLHKGKPFALIPCPFEECGCESYAYHFGNELISTFKDFGIKNEIIWTHELYKTKEMHKMIKIALENTEEIKEILRKYILPTLDDSMKKKFLEMQKTWTPVMAICEKCSKIQSINKDGTIKPNRVIKYNKSNQTVTYECPACGNKTETSIKSGNLKLNWRIDWPAKWAIFKTTCEPAGKDHSVKGGAYDTGLEICEEIFGYMGPVKVPYEWLRLGDYDMKTSKGIVFTPKKYLTLADPEIYRMLILKTVPMKHISLRIEEYPQHYDFYDRMEKIYYSIEKAETEEEREFLQYLYPLTIIDKIPDKRPIRLPFKLLTFLSQVGNILSIEKLYNKAKTVVNVQDFEKMITIEEFEILLNRVKNWIDEVKIIIENEKDENIKRNIMEKVTIFTIPENIDENVIDKLNERQIKGINLIREFIAENNNLNSELIQNKIFTIAKDELQISPQKMFEALYQIILGKEFGPRLGSFLLLLDKNWLLTRLNI